MYYDPYYKLPVKTMPSTEQLEIGHALKTAVGEERKILIRRLVDGNMGLIGRYINRYHSYGTNFSDCCQEGVFGLQKAAERFNPDKAKFSTYAYKWIGRYVKRCKDELIRLPENKRLAFYPKASLELRVNRKDMNDAQEPWCASIGEPLDNHTKGDILDIVVNEETKRSIERATRNVSQRDMDIFYAVNQDSKSLAKVGREKGLTRERVRQINNKVLKQIQSELQESR